MRAKSELPVGYRQIYTVDLQQDKKAAIIVNVLGAVIAVVMLVAGHFVVPITSLFDMTDGLLAYSMRFLALFLAIVLYFVLHELVHGITMKLYGTKKVKYGFTGMYAFAGSEDYYGKLSYITIALAPVVLWGIVLAVVCPFVPQQWFWVVYFIQVSNISGAAGDLFVTVKFLRMPKDILVRDSGVGMRVYSAQEV